VGCHAPTFVVNLFKLSRGRDAVADGVLSTPGVRTVMWPWGHLAFGYVGYLLVRPWAIRRADRVAVLAALFGSLFPDLVDKPLAWGLAVLPSGRSLAHSVFALIIVSAVVWVVAVEYDRREAGIAFPIGYVTHLVGDGLVPIYEGSYGELSYLLWPLLPAPAYDEPTGILDALAVFGNPEFSPMFLAEVAVAAGFGLLCAYHFVFRAEW
jgi:hypothetical protein